MWLSNWLPAACFKHVVSKAQQCDIEEIDEEIQRCDEELAKNDLSNTQQSREFDSSRPVETVVDRLETDRGLLDTKRSR